MTDLIYPVPAHAKTNSHLTPEKYDAMYQESITSPDSFWKKQSAILDWIKEPTVIKNTNFSKDKFER